MSPGAATLARFGIVGAAGAATYFLALVAMVEGLGTPVLAATSIAFVLVVLQNYACHYAWTFATDAPHARAAPQFVAMSAAGFAINWLVMALGTGALALDYRLVQAVAVAAVLAWNASLSHLVVFRRA
jgi:putative flippase GtrA